MRAVEQRLAHQVEQTTRSDRGHEPSPLSSRPRRALSRDCAPPERPARGQSHASGCRPTPRAGGPDAGRKQKPKFSAAPRAIAWRSMRHGEIQYSHLPSLLLPCPRCGHRMTLATVQPALLDTGAASDDLEDVTHCCEQCGASLTRTIRIRSNAATVVSG
jgi:hypothetical protein